MVAPWCCQSPPEGACLRPSESNPGHLGAELDGADRDRPALTDEQGARSEGRLQGADGGLGGGMIHRRKARQATAQVADLHPNALRGYPEDVITHQLVDPVRVLVDHEPAADLGM